ncbi:MAG: lipoate--protein ligase [Desulfobacterales bacterium]|jgi:lipoate-protein ligase A
MLCLHNEGLDADFNLAAEEYLLTTLREPAFMVWRNHPAVIIGRNQNPYREANSRELESRGVPILRRISGGGAVYHDTGNINFTVLTPAPGAPRIDYQTPLKPILRFLRSMGLQARFDGGNGLALNGKKISGNAQHIHKQMILHHGTLLFDTDLEALTRTLAAGPPGKYQDRGVNSVRQPVANLRPLLARDFTVMEFMTQLIKAIQSQRNGRRARFSDADLQAIEALAAARYRSWEWNFGRTPDYRLVNAVCGDKIRVEIQMQVCAGRIRRIEVGGAKLSGLFAQSLDDRLKGCRHLRQDVAAALMKVDWETAPAGVTRSHFTEALF